MTLPEQVDAVVIPLDGSPLSLRALPVGVVLAQRFGADIHLFSAVSTADQVPARDAEFAAIAQRLDGERTGRMVVVEGDVPSALHDALKRVRPAAACMATRGRGRSGALLGSVALETAARGHDPLVLVGPFCGDGPRVEQGPRGVVVCVDGSRASAALVAEALPWAKRLHEPMVIVTAAEPVPEPVRPHPVHRRFGPEGDVAARLAELALPGLGNGVDVSTRVLWDPVSPADGVRSYLRDCPAFLTVVGSRARTGLDRLLFASVASAIVLHSRSPVVLIPRGT